MIRAVGIVIALGSVFFIGTSMLAPKARYISHYADFTVINTALDPLASTVTEPI